MAHRLMNSKPSYQRDIRVMGIINLTADSFYSGSRQVSMTGEMDLDKIASTISGMKDEGADIIDLGACSTRPGNLQCGAELEWLRLEPVLELVKERFPDMNLSIDTVWSSVVEKACICLGREFIVNDVSLSGYDSRLLPAVAEMGFEYVAMHNVGASEHQSAYPLGVTAAVQDFFENFSSRAESLGLRRWIVDPGFGFSKTLDDNWRLLVEMEALRSFGRPILAGVSRKSFIYKLTGTSPEESLPSTQATQMLALQHGTDILRVHDVKEAVETIAIYRKAEEMLYK